MDLLLCYLGSLRAGRSCSSPLTLFSRLTVETLFWMKNDSFCLTNLIFGKLKTQQAIIRDQYRPLEPPLADKCRTKFLRVDTKWLKYFSAMCHCQLEITSLNKKNCWLALDFGIVVRMHLPIVRPKSCVTLLFLSHSGWQILSRIQLSWPIASSIFCYKYFYIKTSIYRTLERHSQFQSLI